jgi:hypothetical protein
VATCRSSLHQPPPSWPLPLRGYQDIRDLRVQGRTRRQHAKIGAEPRFPAYMNTFSGLSLPFAPGAYIRLRSAIWVSWTGPIDFVWLARSADVRRWHLPVPDPRTAADGSAKDPFLGLSADRHVVRYSTEHPYLGFTPVASVGRTPASHWAFDECCFGNGPAVILPTANGRFTFSRATIAALTEARDLFAGPGLAVLHLSGADYHPKEEWLRQPLIFPEDSEDELLWVFDYQRRQFLWAIAAVTYLWARNPYAFLDALRPGDRDILFEVGVGNWRMARLGIAFDLRDFGLDVDCQMTFFAQHNIPSLYE